MKRSKSFQNVLKNPDGTKPKGLFFVLLKQTDLIKFQLEMI